MERAGGLVKAGLFGRHAVNGLRRLGELLLDLAYPPACLHCDAPLAAANAICSSCFKGLRHISAPLCPITGVPFAVSLGADALSAEAIADPPPFGRARAAVVYNDIAGALVSRLKYGDRPELAWFCGQLMASAGHELWAERPVLVPIPLHPSRRRARRYNQSAELAQVIGRLTGLSVDPALVRRIRKTRQQVGLSGDGRQRNVAGAFAVHPDMLVRTGGRRVVLVDDVYTTGATVKAVTRSLRKAGVEAVDVITFARVVIGAE